MGLGGFIKALLGVGRKKREETSYIPPVMPTEGLFIPERPPQLREMDKRGAERADQWKRLKSRWEKMLEEERKKRSKYGGF